MVKVHLPSGSGLVGTVAVMGTNMTTFTRSGAIQPSNITELPSLTRNPLAWLRAAIRRFEERRQREAAEGTLQGLDNRTLRDIGVDRSEIASLVYGAETDMTRIDRAA